MSSLTTVEEARALLCPCGARPIRLGLERIRLTLSRLGSPERCVPAVLVAGTNGKGSTAALLESMLRSAGLSTFLYTSPHLRDWPERFRFDGRPIRWATLLEALNVVEAARGETPLTPFERLTLAGFCLARERRPHIAILEVGLGGRLDATRVVSPVLSLVTMIGLDHQALLGTTIEQIAREKAGIFDPGVPALTSERGAGLAPLRDAALARGTPLTAVVPSDDRGVVRFEEWTSPPLRCGLLGDHQNENLALAAAAYRVLSVQGRCPESPEAMIRGAAEVTWPGRLQLVARKPSVIVDGAHNPAAARALARSLSAPPFSRPLHVVLGMLSDKDHAGFLAAIAPQVDQFHLVRVASERAVAPEVFLAGARDAPCLVHSEGVSGVVQRLRESLRPEACVLVTGSLYLVGEYLSGL